MQLEAMFPNELNIPESHFINVTGPVSLFEKKKTCTINRKAIQALYTLQLTTLLQAKWVRNSFNMSRYYMINQPGLQYITITALH